jgi:hypothetical protein
LDIFYLNRRLIIFLTLNRSRPVAATALLKALFDPMWKRELSGGVGAAAAYLTLAKVS